ncbi:hypothetical protein NDU88_000397 [Pleurodeles waltl]|uniref:Uncharacterized protein n=1 Tax=Pleurodeles waltl TaxID=8319 RepID=A0AAV7URR3_PLEWA|nr:hypothetical protein NDU88_000397 [Pleurodeles waltl]
MVCWNRVAVTRDATNRVETLKEYPRGALDNNIRFTGSVNPEGEGRHMTQKEEKGKTAGAEEDVREDARSKTRRRNSEQKEAGDAEPTDSDEEPRETERALEEESLIRAELIEDAVTIRHVPGGMSLLQVPACFQNPYNYFKRSIEGEGGKNESERGIGAERHRSSRTWRNRRLQKLPRPEKKQLLLGGAERRLNRKQRKPLKTAADPGELNARAATLQEKRGLSRYGERYKGKRVGDGRSWEKKKKKRTRGTHLKEKSPPPTRTEQSSVTVACILPINPINQIY